MDIISLPTEKNHNKGKRKRNTVSYIAWIRQHVSEMDLGLEVKDANGIHPIHLNTNQQILDHFDRLHQGDPSWLQHQWNWYKLKDHGYQCATYYFAGAPERRKSRTMFLLDVDCKRRGTPEGAQEYLTYLASDECAQEYGLSFPHLYREVSTHGRGGHGFPLLDKWDLGPELINDLLLHRLQPLLNRIAKDKDFNIELVEVKGTLPVVEWGEGKYEVRAYKAGCLGKLPREGEARFDELKKTAVITGHDLLRLPIVEKTPRSRSVTVQAPAVVNTGSISGKHITEDMLAEVNVGGQFRAIAERLLGTHCLATSGRQVVTVEDVAITLMLGDWFTDNMPANGAMPEARWKGMWTSLYECGDISRAWCHKRFKVIRDWLSSLGLLNWEDKEYVLGWHDENGNYHKGKAAKWRFSDELMQMLDKANVEEIETTAISAALIKGEEEKHPLWEHELQEWIESLIRLPDHETIRPVQHEKDSIYWFNPDEINQFIEPFELLAA